MDNSPLPATSLPVTPTLPPQAEARRTFGQFGKDSGKAFKQTFSKAVNNKITNGIGKFYAPQLYAKSAARKAVTDKLISKKADLTSQASHIGKQSTFHSELAKDYKTKAKFAQKEANELRKIHEKNSKLTRKEYSAEAKLAAKNAIFHKDQEARSMRLKSKMNKSQADTYRYQAAAAQRARTAVSNDLKSHLEAGKLKNRLATGVYNHAQKLNTALLKGTGNLAKKVAVGAVKLPFQFAGKAAETAMKAPFRAIANRGSWFRGQGRAHGNAYGGAFGGAAGRNIGAKLLTGVMPNRANMAALIRGSMLGMDSAGQNAGNVFSRAFSGAFGIIKTGLTAALVGTGLAAGAIASSGINRALNIEDSKAKLSGLGNSAQEVSNIMDSVTNSVLGTKFSLDQAMNIGTGALAAGIPAGEELTKYLRLTADAATIAGVDMERMGRIMNKTTANNTLWSQEGNQFADKGVPIWAWLAEARHISVGELKKLVEQGKITAAEFRDVMQKKIGGVALKSAETTRGAFSNMRIAYARFGAAMLGGALPAVRQLFVENMKLADHLSSTLGPKMKDFWLKWGPVIQKKVADIGASVTKLFDGGYNNEPMIVWIKTLWQAIKNFGSAIKQLEVVQWLIKGFNDIFKNADGSMKPFEKSLQAVIDKTGWLWWGIKHLYDFLMGATMNKDNFLNVMFRQAQDLFEAMKPQLKALMPVVGALVLLLANGLGGLLKNILPAIAQVLPVIAQKLAIVMGAAAPKLAEWLPKIPGILADLFLAGMDFIDKLIPIIANAMPGILSIIKTIGELIAYILPPLIALLSANNGGLIKEVIKILVGAVGILLAAIMSLVILGKLITTVIGGLITAIMDLVTFFQSGKWGTNFTDLMKDTWTLGGTQNNDKLQPNAMSLQNPSADAHQSVLGKGIIVPAQQPAGGNSYSMSVTNNTDVDAERTVQKMKEYFANQAGGNTYSYGTNP